MAKPRDILEVIIHCSDSPDKLDIGFNEINRWHKERGFDGVEVTSGNETKRIYCGYHYIVKRDGMIDIGRPEWAIGAHCVNHNAHSIGICWAGRFAPTDKQRQALILLIKSVCLKYALPYHRIHGHKEFNMLKTCPNLDMDLIRDDVRKLLQGDPNGLS